jgi:hypothetical protein
MQMLFECGAAGYLVLGLTLLALLFALVAVGVAVLRPRIGILIAAVAVAASCTPGGAGILGTQLGRAKVDAVLAGPAIDPEVRERIRNVGYAEAAQCTPLGLGGSVPPLVLALVALAVAAARRAKRSA